MCSRGLVKGHTNTQTIYYPKPDIWNLSSAPGKQDPVLCYAAATGYLNDVGPLYGSVKEIADSFPGVLAYCSETRSDVESGGAQVWCKL